jgi:hypothetical protein
LYILKQTFIEILFFYYFFLIFNLTNNSLLYLFVYKYVSYTKINKLSILFKTIHSLLHPHLINEEKYLLLSDPYNTFMNSLYSSQSFIKFYSSAYCHRPPSLFFLATSERIYSDNEHYFINLCNCYVYFCLY